MTEPSPVPPIEPPPTPQTSRPLHTLPTPFSHNNLTPITQGAEALVYKTTFLTPHTPVVVKYRPPKPYRHPTLDKRLTKQRLLAEARSLVRCRKEGVKVPAVLGADWDEGWLVLEWIEGGTVRGVLDEWTHIVEEKSSGDDGRKAEDEMLDLMRRVGKEVGKLHELGVCHGDLTTSNLMLRRDTQQQGKDEGMMEERGSQSFSEMPQGRQTTSSMREAAMNGDMPPSSSLSSPPSIPSQSQAQPQPSQSLKGDIYLIDFGLTTASIQEEDKAVDLYVLERAFAATHPAAEPLFQEVLKAYGESSKGAKGVLKKLEGVRMRGRKRSMLG